MGIKSLPIEVIERWLLSRGTLKEALGLKWYEIYLESELGLSVTRFHINRTGRVWDESVEKPFYLDFPFTEDELLELLAFALNEVSVTQN